MGSLARASLRTYLRHPLQTLLSIVGIALGVGVVLAIGLTTMAAERAFALTAESVGGRATHEIVAAGANGIDEALYARLRREHGLRSGAPVVSGSVRQIADDGMRGDSFSLVGIDIFAEAPLRPYFAFGSRASDGADFDLARFLTSPGGVAISETAARARGLRVGDTIEVDATGFRSTLTVVSLLRPSDPLVTRGLAQVLLADIATAQEVLRRPGRLDRIDLVLGSSGAEVDAVRALLPEGIALRTTAARRGALSGMTSAFRLNLQALGLLTLAVGAFLIFNTVSFAVVRRRRSLGVLRTIGASRGKIFRTVIGEAMALGVVGTALGFGLGIGIAHALLGIVTRTISDHYFATTVTDVELSAFDIGLALTLGLGTCLIAALAPARDATRIATRAALARSTLESRSRRRVGRGVLLAFGVIGLGAAILATGQGGLPAAYVGLFAVLLGAAALTPAVCLLVAAACRPLCRRLLGAPGHQAARSVGASLSRTGVATAALMFAMATTVGLGAMIGSFRGGVERWLRASLVADVYVSPPAGASERFRVRMDDAAVTAMTAVDGLEEPSVRYRRFRAGARLSAAEPEFIVSCVAMDPLARIIETIDPIETAPAASVLRRELLAQGGVLVSEPFAAKRGLARGDTIDLRARQGWVTLPVRYVFYDYGSEAGYLAMPESTRRQHFEDDGVSALGLFAADGTDSGTLADRVRRAYDGAQELSVQATSELLRTSLEIFDRTFAVTGALRLLCLLVAFLGIWSALMALQLERRREIGVLRALGATPGQVRTLITTQTGLLGLAAGLWSIPVGAALGWILVRVVNKRSFGWTLLDFEVPPVVAIEAIALAVGAALLAGLQPAIWFGRVRVVDALREEG